MESIEGMNKVLQLLTLIIAFYIPFASADTSLDISPDPLHGQLWAFETYQLHTNSPEINLSNPEYMDFEFTGDLIYDYTINWNGVGQYYHGTGVTGYSYDLDTFYYHNLARIGDNSLINVTLEKNLFQYGMKPYEDIKIRFTVDIFLEIIKEGIKSKGPKVDSTSKTMFLVDDKKVSYLEDKFLDLQSEINITVNTQGLEDFRRSKYLEITENMNNSISNGDYSEALEIWDDWIRKDRERMFTAYSDLVSIQSEELESYKGIEVSMENLQTEYNFLEDKYFAVLSANQEKLEELETVKKGLTTSITGVFLSAIVFFFLGRRSIIGDNP
jgi:hypothetical protein